MHYSYDTIVIGGGQAGLAIAQQLLSRDRDVVILDAGARTGDAWRNRWDSLELFTPAQHCSLPGLPFPAPRDTYPGKDDVADYLEAYAAHFALPIVHGQAVISLRRIDGDDGYIVETATRSYSAREVVVATGPFTTPAIPSIAARLPRDVVQMHSSDYRRPSQLPDGPVAIVGGGSSGIQIAAELSASRTTYLAVGGKDVRLPKQVLGTSVFTILDRIGAFDLGVTTPLGRRASRREIVIEHSPETIARAHPIELVDRVVGANGNRLTTLSARSFEVASVIWATGYRASYPWIDVPVFGDDGGPVHTRGVTAAPGLSFIGLPWMHSRGSALLGWVGRDAAYLAGVMTARRRSEASAPSPRYDAVRPARPRHARVAPGTAVTV